MPAPCRYGRVVSGDVVALGAWCDLVPPLEYSASPGGVSFTVGEFADLDDGRRVTLHAERGFTTLPRGRSERERLIPSRI